MRALELILLLLALSAGLRLVAEWLHVPYPSLLVVGGALLAITPGLPQVALPPDTLFLIFVPPLLYWGAVTYPPRDVRRRAGAIIRLAVVLVLVSMCAVAIAVHEWDPAFTWPAAFALGAIVSPPDPVAVLSMMRALRLPRVVETLLEGEGLFNDVTALVAYRIAVAAAVTGEFSAWHAAREFAFAAIVGVVFGTAVGMLVFQVHRLARTVIVAEMAVSLLTPFASYLGAEAVGASGVLAVVATGLYTSRRVPRIVGPQARLQAVVVWDVVTFLLESLVFILVGLELPKVVHQLDRPAFFGLLREAILVTVVLIVVRVLWVPSGAYTARMIARRIYHPSPERLRFGEVAFVSWAGLRGGDSLVIALALPFTIASGAPFPAREQIVFITFSVIFATLVIVGPTLPIVARLLRLERGAGEAAEEVHARLAAVEAGLRVLDLPEVSKSSNPEVLRYLRRRHVQRARRWASREARTDDSETPWLDHDHETAAPSHESGELDDERAAEYRRVRNAMIDAELDTVLDLRDQGAIDDTVMRRIQRDLDFEAMMLEAREPVVEPPSEAGSTMQKDGG